MRLQNCFSSALFLCARVILAAWPVPMLECCNKFAAASNPGARASAPVPAPMPTGYRARIAFFSETARNPSCWLLYVSCDLNNPADHGKDAAPTPSSGLQDHRQTGDPRSRVSADLPATWGRATGRRHRRRRYFPCARRRRPLQCQRLNDVQLLFQRRTRAIPHPIERMAHDVAAHTFTDNSSEHTIFK